MPDDPPKDFHTAEKLFREFLISQGYPPEIKWAFIEDMIPTKGGHYWARQDPHNENAIKAKRLYQVGLEKNLGVALNAFGKSDYSSFATVFVPKDDMDAQYHLMGRCLKQTCATSPISVHVAANLVQWYLLRLRNRALVRLLRETGEI